MQSELLPGYPTVEGTWRVGEVREHEMRPIERIEAIVLSQVPRFPDMLRFVRTIGAAANQGEPVIVSGAYLYLICNAWLGPMFQATMPVSAYWQFKQPVYTGQPLLARCVLKEPRRIRNILMAELHLELYAGHDKKLCAVADVPIQMRV